MRPNETSRWLHWLIVPVACLVLLPVGSVRAKTAAAPIGVANAASYDAAVAPGSIAALFGTNMTGLSEASAQSLPLPTVLAGLSVKVNGLTAPLFYASAGQINFQVPSGVDSGTATVTVFAGSTVVGYGTALVAESAPGIFSVDLSGKNQAVAQNSDYSTNSDFDRFPGSRPEVGGQYVVLYATGIGRTNPLVPDGQPSPGSPLAQANGQTTVMIAGVQAQVLFSGLVPGFVGLWQINAVIPSTLATNLTSALTVSLNNRSSAGTTLAIANKNDFGSVNGVVVNALTGAPFTGANLALQPQGNGKSRSIATAADGTFNLQVIAPGAYTLAASSPGFITASQSASVAGGAATSAGTMALTAPLESAQYRVVVAWKQTIDLDAHLTGPAGGTRFHVWWNGSTDLGTPVGARFDRDDTTGAGPETLTFTPSSGAYRLSVQNYSGRDNSGNSDLAASAVTVYVFKGSQQVAVLKAPAGGGTLWKVLEINNGQLSITNQLSDEPDPSMIKAAY
jgi:uncharacterized protein (TIGR03437 family)